MASAARIAANRLTAREGAGPRTPGDEAAMRRSPLRHPPAEFRSTAPQPPRDRSREKSYLGLAEPIYRMRSVGAISAESRFHAAGNRSSPVVRPSTHALTRVAQDAGAVPSLSKDALNPSSRDASGRPSRSHQPRSCTVTMRRLLDAGYGAVTGAANPGSGKTARVAANPHHATPRSGKRVAARRHRPSRHRRQIARHCPSAREPRCW